jgi:dienelactone hydrolase
MRFFTVAFWLAPLILLVRVAAAEDSDVKKTKWPSVAQLPAVAELPDPFLRTDGTRVRTKDDWSQQRKELLARVLHYEYGPLPPVPDNVAAKELSSKKIEATGATETELLLTMGPKNAIQTHVILTVPAGKGPFPAIIRGDLGWGRVKPEIVANIVKRGYILADFSRVEIAPDSAEKAGVYAAYPDYQGGRLAAWAWGYHRVVDYLLTRDDVDKKHIAVTGHSRGGKTALLAGATDERIALTVPNNSGCGGAGCYRLQADKSEDIAAITKNFPFWFAPHFTDFIGKTDRLPFDQHTVKALVAPRALLSTEALGDLWANPKGTQQSYAAAKEVFNFLGAGDRIGIVFREGKHEQNVDDWTVLLDFADKQFFGKKVERRFDAMAFPDAPKGYSWKAPASPDNRRPQPEGGQAAALVTEFLPVLLKKALLENQRGYLTNLERILKLCVALEEGGDLTKFQVDQVDEELHQARISLLERETTYRDALDEYKLRFDLQTERMKQIEETALIPIMRQLPRFDEVINSFENAKDDISKKLDPDKPGTLRERVRSVVTTSALVKGTRFQDQIMGRWKALSELSEAKLKDQRRESDQEHTQLLDSQAEQKIAGKQLPEKQKRRLSELEFQIRLSDLERSLRRFESAPWKKFANETQRDRELARVFDDVLFACRVVLVEARNERLDLVEKSWPKLAEVRFRDVDLIVCDQRRAERLVSELSDKNAALAARRHLRRVRQLAESYPMQQRAVLLAFIGAEGAREALVAPPPPRKPGKGEGKHTEGGTEALVAPPRPDESPPQAHGPEAESRDLVGAQRALAQRKDQILTTWVGFQLARLKLYGALAISPP